jgi:hypothetical protein
MVLSGVVSPRLNLPASSVPRYQVICLDEEGTNRRDFVTLVA